MWVKRQCSRRQFGQRLQQQVVTLLDHRAADRYQSHRCRGIAAVRASSQLGGRRKTAEIESVIQQDRLVGGSPRSLR